MEINLLEKTELWIEDITLESADLNRVAEVTADVLGIERSRVLVVDVRDNRLTLDILQKKMQAEQVFGKKEELLRRLAIVDGVKVTERTEIHSDGILGMIALDEKEVGKVISQSSAIVVDVLSRIARRACIFPTGFEVKGGMIKDTNTAFIKSALEERGLKVSCGEALDDDKDLIAGRIRRAADDGFGLVVTTGGVGAESKDRTVEAVLSVDPEAQTPYIVHFTKGTGRHEKDGVRIAVGKVGVTTIVSLPGPNDEVRMAVPVLLESLEKGWEKMELAAALASVLRAKFRIGHSDHPAHQGEEQRSTKHEDNG